MHMNTASPFESSAESMKQQKEQRQMKGTGQATEIARELNEAQHSETCHGDAMHRDIYGEL